MKYDCIEDMFLDNRSSFVNEMVKLGASEEVKMEALQAYDWAAGQACQLQGTCMVYKKVCPKFIWKRIEKKACKHFREIDIPGRNYIKGITRKKKVGYSAAENKDESENT